MALALAGVLSARGAAVATSQTVSLKTGWNAFYLTVTPGETADELFADWPVASVGYYNPAAFLETKQFSSSESTEGSSQSGYLTWRRGEPGLSSFTQPVGNGVYVCFATNDWSATVYGTPVAPRNTWHVSSTNEPMNMIGIACGATGTTLGAYFSGLTTGNTSYYTYKLWGQDASAPKLTAVYGTSPLANGDVVVSSASKLSDWSGVLNVTPMTGLDFSTNLTRLACSVRNDSASTRTVSLSLGSGESAETPPPVPTGLLCQTNGGSWVAFSADSPLTATLATNETLEVVFALDRTKLTGSAGTYYGGLLAIRDVTSGGSDFLTLLPVEATSDGGVSSAEAWPKGVWLASVTLDEVLFMETSTVATNKLMQTAGGEMKLRLPLRVDGDGKLTLLQRFWYGSDTNALRRVSTPFLPVDQPEIVASSGEFGTTATFPFTVESTSRANPYRHALHPQHGDDSGNLFSISNTVIFTWNGTTGTAWNPEETVSGTCEWYFGGLRREGDVKARGTFRMRRVLRK